MVDDAPAGPVARFKAVLAGGGAEELEALRSVGARIRGHVGRAVSFDAPLAQAESLARAHGVLSLDIAHRLTPELDVSGPAVGADLVRDPAGPGATGSGVLVADVDTGQDLKHRDFRTAARTTRFKSVYNMDPACRGTPPPLHSEGCYYNEARINKYLRGKVGLNYADVPNTLGHGSHTMGIAAGNGLATGNSQPASVYVGMAPGADLVGVKVFDKQGNQVGDLVEALDFLKEEQDRLLNLPLVVNMSLGHQFGAHDGTDPDEVAIDDFVSDGITSGIVRVVAKSAGNSELDDIYTTGQTAVGAPALRTFTIPSVDAGTGAACGSISGAGNDSFLVDMWYPGDADITVRVTAPGGAAYSYFENRTGHDPNSVDLDTTAGSIFVDCPGQPYALNGDRECVFGVDDTGGVAPAAGIWTVSIFANAIPSGGHFDAWIGLAQKGRCFWGWDSPDPGHSISIPGTAFNAITVGAWVTRNEWINIDRRTISYGTPGPPLDDIGAFSSTGPTRDGRTKPDIAAPGQGIASVRARNVSISRGTEARLRTMPDGKHLVLEGTSMSSPHVAGALALLLSIDPTLDADTLRTLLTDNADVDSFTGGVPNNVWGHGKLNVYQAALAVKAAKRQGDPAP